MSLLSGAWQIDAVSVPSQILNAYFSYVFSIGSANLDICRTVATDAAAGMKQLLLRFTAGETGASSGEDFYFCISFLNRPPGENEMREALKQRFAS